ncbi:hypothetical protein SAMD00019534_094270 [Acytostelium subglobosum LB1]|uniref:hypothetical protein n=1 Tax=Acytostelium subglobosum LB1 TaxID=1410327 RepID=UPI000645043E|nr:hypothetical protein SAMD00019534_094270 [Acytostelium subglobosum LB1]GAM26252.1 hypothetical protein SAMD00019534_094270 [Acytostelium subglobosum LB1]|eukprot:XP_012750806.1 hypothetical protein SAMD00019534_094270 [Acytostelium subglobosum LB1]
MNEISFSSSCLRRHGISLGVLKLLHEEYDSLYPLGSLFCNTMVHCARCNLVDSFQYIVDNIPENNRPSLFDRSVSDSLKFCASNGNIAIFDILYNSPNTKEYVTEKDLNIAIRKAAKHGHPTMINHLFKYLASESSSSSGRQPRWRRDRIEKPPMGISIALMCSIQRCA